MAHSGIRLDWDGRRPPEVPDASATALTCAEVYSRTENQSGANRLIQGDNLAVMAALREEYAGRFALVYLDPPFFTGVEWAARKDAESRMAAFSDSWNGDLGAYLQWILDRVTVARELLADEGSLYVHLSWHAAHYVKVLLDEVFGVERFQNEIVWCYREAINSKKRWNRKHDTLLFYSKGDRFTFNHAAVLMPYAESNVRKYRKRDERGPYRLMGRGIEGSPLRSKRDLAPEMESLFPELTYRHYLGDGTLPVDYWLIDIENQASHVRTGYPTQKPEALLERVLLASSNPGDLIGDFCCGSGTTLAVAQRLGRLWAGCDVGDLAIHTCRKRLLEGQQAPDFSIETLVTVATDPEAMSFTEGGARVRMVRAATGWRLELDERDLSGIDMWAVEWLFAQADRASAWSMPFIPDWWSARTRRSSDILCVSAPTGDGGPPLSGARVVVYDAAGSVREIRLRAPDPS